MSPGLRVQVIGPLRVWRDGVERHAGGRQQRCLLAQLAVRADRPVSTAELVDLTWGDDPPATAVNIVQKYVGGLRRLLEPELPPRSAGSYLLRHGGGYRFRADAATLDLVRFRRWVGAARASVAADRTDEALDRYAGALRLWHGATGEALADTPAVTAAFARVDGEFLDAAVAAAEVAVRAGRPATVLAALRRAARLGPLDEAVHAALVTTLAAAGRQAEALSVYLSIRDRLADELGLDPGPALRVAQQTVLGRTARCESCRR